MKINISNLSQGTHEYELSKSAVEIGLQEHFVGDIAAKVTLEKSTSQILLRARITSNAVFACDRCLDEFKKEISPAFQMVYVWDAQDQSIERDEDVRTLTVDTNIIDISDTVRDVVLLAIPLKLLCREECAGLCPRCGKNLNHTANGRCDCARGDVDSRWNKLAGLVEVTISKKKTNLL
ncbi:MAG: DUF177 domain-containing protein [Bacteroidota bacterium]